MSTPVRWIVIAICAIALWYLAVQLGRGTAG